MRLAFCTASLALMLASGASAETLDVSMQSFDNNFQALLRHGLTERAAQLEGVDVHEDADRREQVNERGPVPARLRRSGALLDRIHAQIDSRVWSPRRGLTRCDL